LSKRLNAAKRRRKRTRGCSATLTASGGRLRGRAAIEKKKENYFEGGTSPFPNGRRKTKKQNLKEGRLLLRGRMRPEFNSGEEKKSSVEPLIKLGAITPRKKEGRTRKETPLVGKTREKL